MIDITLRFASLELAITALAAVRQATGTESAGNAPQPDKAAPAKADAKPKKDAAETKPTAAPAPTAASPTPPAESKSPTTSSGVVTRDQVSAQIKAGAATNREATVATLAKFDAKAGKDLKDDQLAEFSAALAKALEPADDLG